MGLPGKTLLIKMWKFHFVSSANVMPGRLTGPNWLITRLNVFLVALKIRSILIYTFVIKPKRYLHASGLLTAYNATAFSGLAADLSTPQAYNKAQPLRISPKMYRYLEAEHTTSAIHSQNTSNLPIYRQNTPFLPIDKIWAFSWGGMILRETLTLPCSNSYQHEQNDEGNTQPPAPRIECHS